MRVKNALLLLLILLLNNCYEPPIEEPIVIQELIEPYISDSVNTQKFDIELFNRDYYEKFRLVPINIDSLEFILLGRYSEKEIIYYKNGKQRIYRLKRY
jgi:hypothetical protein